MGYELSCHDLDHTCGWRGRGETQDELMSKVADHVQKVHNVKTVTDTIVNYAKTKVRRV